MEYMKEKKIPMIQEEYQNLQMKIENLTHSQFSAHKEYEGEEIIDVRESLLWKINELKNKIYNAIIIEPSDDVIDIGDKVTILTDGIETEEITLVLYDGNALKKRISIESDFGERILGRKIGDIVTYSPKMNKQITETVQILGITKSYKDKGIAITKKL
jgi:transcription elongation GreA/GreB family factor